MNFLRRLAANSPLRRILLHPSVRRVLASILALRFVPAAWQVDRPYIFALMLRAAYDIVGVGRWGTTIGKRLARRRGSGVGAGGHGAHL